MKSFWKAGAAALVAACMIAASFGPAAAQQESRLDKIIASKTLTVGIILSLPPFGMKNDAGEPDGFDVDVAKLAAEKLGAKLEIVDTTAADRIPNLRTDKVDMIIGQFTRNSERAKVVSFSDPYITAVVMAIAVPKDSPITSVDLSAFDGKSVGVQSSTTHAAYAEQELKGADVKYYKTADDYKLDLSSGRLDAAMDDVVVLSEWLKTPDGACCKLLGTLKLVPEIHGKGTGIGVRKEDTDLKELFNKGIAAIRANGKYKEINDKYFDFDAYGGE